eukprot:234334_1
MAVSKEDALPSFIEFPVSDGEIDQSTLKTFSDVQKARTNPSTPFMYLMWMNSLKSSSERLKVQRAEIEAELNENRKELMREKEKTQQSNRRVEELEVALQSSTSMFHHSQTARNDKILALSTERTSLREKLDQKSGERSSALRAKESTMAQLVACCDELKQSEAMNEQLKTTIEQQSNKIKRLSNSNENLQTKYRDTHSEKEHLSRLVQELRSKNTKLAKRCDLFEQWQEQEKNLRSPQKQCKVETRRCDWANNEMFVKLNDIDMRKLFRGVVVFGVISGVMYVSWYSRSSSKRNYRAEVE